MPISQVPDYPTTMVLDCVGVYMYAAVYKHGHGEIRFSPGPSADTDNDRDGTTGELPAVARMQFITPADLDVVTNALRLLREAMVEVASREPEESASAGGDGPVRLSLADLLRSSREALADVAAAHLSLAGTLRSLRRTMAELAARKLEESASAGDETDGGPQ